MGAIKHRKSENVKEEFIGDEYDKINGTLCPEKFEGQKVPLMYSSMYSSKDENIKKSAQN